MESSHVLKSYDSGLQTVGSFDEFSTMMMMFRLVATSMDVINYDGEEDSGG